jgi:hypothetical protein
MISTKLASIGLAASLVAFMLPAVSAQAQAPRTFVSAAGTDNPTCSFTAPCRHFQAAVTATSPGGEVDALDPAGYGPINIDRPITIEGQSWSYIAPPANGNGITINAGSGTVSIHGVSLNGVGITGTTNGIVFNSGAVLSVQDSVIKNFSSAGISFGPNNAGLCQFYVSDTLVSSNGGTGILIDPTGIGNTQGVIEHVKMASNQNGLSINTNTQVTAVTVTDSVSANNSFSGVNVQGTSALVGVLVRNSTVVNNGFGLMAQGNGVQLRVTRSSVTNSNGTPTSATSGATLESYDDNNLDGTAPAQIPYH